MGKKGVYRLFLSITLSFSVCRSKGRASGVSKMYIVEMTWATMPGESVVYQTCQLAERRERREAEKRARVSI